MPVTNAAPAMRPGEEPLVTAGLDRQRMVIMAANRAAQALGLGVGMAVTHAKALVAELDVRDADLVGDTAWLERLTLFAIRHWTPTAMIDGTNGILMDLTGAAHLHGGEAIMARRIVRFCGRLGFDARVAFAGNIGAAKALARYGRERITICDAYNEAGTLAPLPIAALRLDGRQLDAARRLGIDRVGDLFSMPRGPLAKRFGASMLERLDQALGHKGEAFEALIPYIVPEEEARLAEPIGSADSITTVIADLTAALVDTLRSRGLGARVVRLECDRVDSQKQVITIGMARGTRDIVHMRRLLGMKVETIDPGFGIDSMRLIAVRTEPLEASHVPGDLTGEEAEPDIDSFVDQVVARIGPRGIYRVTAIESDVPERSVQRIAPMEDAADWPVRWPRPTRILRRPEPIDGVIALLPDQPPRRFIWRGVIHTVVRSDGPERIHGEWWRRSAEAHLVRDYWRVEDENGHRFWLFRRGDGEHYQTGDLSWHIAGFFG